MRGAAFRDFLQPVELKSWFKGQFHCLRGEIRGHWGCSYREDKARRPWTYSVQLSEEHLVHTVGRLVSHLGVSQRGSVHGETALRTKELAGAISLPVPQYKHRATYQNQHNTAIHYLTCLHKTLTPMLWWNCPFQPCLPQSQCGGSPPPEDQLKPLTTPCLLTWEIFRAFAW